MSNKCSHGFRGECYFCHVKYRNKNQESENKMSELNQTENKLNNIIDRLNKLEDYNELVRLRLDVREQEISKLSFKHDNQLSQIYKRIEKLEEKNKNQNSENNVLSPLYIEAIKGMDNFVKHENKKVESLKKFHCAHCGKSTIVEV